MIYGYNHNALAISWLTSYMYSTGARAYRPPKAREGVYLRICAVYPSKFKNEPAGYTINSLSLLGIIRCQKGFMETMCGVWVFWPASNAQ